MLWRSMCSNRIGITYPHFLDWYIVLSRVVFPMLGETRVKLYGNNGHHRQFLFYYVDEVDIMDAILL